MQMLPRWYAAPIDIDTLEIVHLQRTLPLIHIMWLWHYRIAADPSIVKLLGT